LEETEEAQEEEQQRHRPTVLKTFRIEVLQDKVTKILRITDIDSEELMPSAERSKERELEQSSEILGEPEVGPVSTLKIVVP
jgi:hypothetical protein